MNAPLPLRDSAEGPLGKPANDAMNRHLVGLPRRTLAFALTLLPIVALINLGILVWSLGGIDLSKTIVAPGYLTLALALVFVPMAANSVRLALWARFLRVDLGVAGAFRVITGTIVANSITPTNVGGMPLKLLFLMGEGVETRKAVTLLSFQTAEDMVILFSLFGLCASFSGFALADFLSTHPELMREVQRVVASIGWVALGVGLAVIALCLAIATGMLGSGLREWAGRWLGRLRQSASTVAGDWVAVARRGKVYALINISLALLQWSVRFSIAGLVLAAFGIDWHPKLYWLLQYLVQALSSVVPTPGAAGGAEAAFLLLFAPFVELDVRLPAMSAWRLLHFFVPLAGAALAFFLLRRKRWRLVEGPGAPASKEPVSGSVEAP